MNEDICKKIDELVKQCKEDDVQYILRGIVLMTSWYGDQGGNLLNIVTSKEGYDEIKRNPLQDYINFGVQSVDYVRFDVSKKIKFYCKNGNIVVSTKHVGTLEKGTPNDETIEFLIDNADFIDIHY